MAPLALAWARVLPTAILVPALGLRAWPGPARALFGLSIAVSIAPAVNAVPVESSMGWFASALSEIIRGTPVALAAAVPLWAATMVGGLADTLRMHEERVPGPLAESPVTKLGIPFGLFAGAAFFFLGGPARIATALITPALGAHPLLWATNTIVQGITLAVAVASPIVIASIVAEATFALMTRAAHPTHLANFVAPWRALLVLAVMGIGLNEMGRALARAIEDSLPPNG